MKNLAEFWISFQESCHVENITMKSLNNRNMEKMGENATDEECLKMEKMRKMRKNEKIICLASEPTPV